MPPLSLDIHIRVLDVTILPILEQTLVLLVKGLAIAQKFSIGKAIFNLFIPTLIIMFIATIAFILIDAGS